MLSKVQEQGAISLSTIGSSTDVIFFAEGEPEVPLKVWERRQEQLGS